MKALRILALMHEDLVPPEDASSQAAAEADWKMEFDVTVSLKKLGHEVQNLGVGGDLGVIRKAIDEGKPHIVLNLLEHFHGIPVFDQNVVSYLELLRIPYTGCNPRGLMLARDKGLSKKLLAYHRIPVPEFAVFRSAAARCAARSGCSSAHRQVAHARGVDRHLAGLGRRGRRQARRTRALHAPAVRY